MDAEQSSGSLPTAARGARRELPVAPASWLAGSALLLAFAAVVAITIAPASALASPGSPYLRSLGRLDQALRFAIERQPEGLNKSLAASERVCSLAQGAEERGDPVAAAAGWSTLSEAVELLDEPGLSAVEVSFAAVTSTLAETETTFSRAWAGKPARVRALHRGARMLRDGLRRLSDSFAHLRGAFTAWQEHRCEAALASINDFGQAVPEGIDSIGRAMWRLWVISEWRASLSG